jgi:DNA recombination protein RmuC
MEIIYLIIGIVLGCLLAYLLLQGKKKSVEADLLVSRQQTEAEARARADLQGRLDAMSDDCRDLQQQLTTARMSLSAAEAQLAAERRQHDEDAEQRFAGRNRRPRPTAASSRSVVRRSCSSSLPHSWRR